MNEVQKALYNIFKDLVKLLEENNIKWVSLGGTAIGALREKGFIPWDDDIDIAIRYEDWEVLRNALKGTKYELSSNFPHLIPIHFDKVVDSSVQFYSEKQKSVQDAYIDIFFITPEYKINFLSKLKYVIYQFIYYEVRCNSLKFLVNKENIFWALGVKLLSGLFFWKTKNGLNKSINKILYKRKKTISDKQDANAMDWKHKTLFSDNTMDRVAEFHDLKVFVPTNFEKDLYHAFGDIYKRPDVDDKYYYSHTLKIYDPTIHTVLQDWTINQISKKK